MNTTEFQAALTAVSGIRVGGNSKRLNLATTCVLMALLHAEEGKTTLTMTKLAEAACITTAAMTGTRDRLVELHLVHEIAATDRRSTCLALSGDGYAVAMQIRTAIEPIGKEQAS